MKVFISSDIEGISGVVGDGQSTRSGADYARVRKLMTQDINAAVEGAFAGGAAAVVINDGHGAGTNVLIEELDPRAQLISGDRLYLSQMGGIDETFGVVLFVGHHAMEGTADGVLNHTFLGRTINRLTMNGRPVGEMGVNGAIAGHFGVPVGLATGDDRACAEASSFFTGIETVVTKTSVSRTVAESLTPGRSHKLIRQAAEAAVRKAPFLSPFLVELPVTFEVEFKSTAETTLATLFPSVRRTGPKSVRVTAPDVVKAFKMLWGVFELGMAGV
jgi:D-amino peptidase